jgi:hypothetical protein
MSGPGKPELSWTQLVAAGLATATTAFGASYLGVGGTIIGAAFMSVASTAGATLYKHYLERGKNQLIDRMPTLGTRLHGEETRNADDPSAAFPAHDAHAYTVAGDAGPNETVAMDPVGSEETRLDLPIITEDEVGAKPWRHWPVLAISAAVVFLAVLGGIAGVEALTGSRVGGSSLTGISSHSVSNNKPAPTTTPSDGSTEGHSSTPRPDSSQTGAPHTTAPTTPATTKPTVPTQQPNPAQSGNPNQGNAKATHAP